MKDFLWRMRTTALWFLAAMAIFTGAYIGWAFSQHDLYGVSPVVLSMFTILCFFFIYAKRYTYDESFLLGEDRKTAVTSAYSGAALYSVIFAFYALGLSLIVRRTLLSAPNLIVNEELYHLSAWEIVSNFFHLFFTNMIAFSLADMLRKFKSWKFWFSLLICVACFFLLGYYCMLKPMNEDLKDTFDFWSGIFSLIVPLSFVMIGCDIFMTRGRQYR